MKTRNEMVYDFMVALCANANNFDLLSESTSEKLSELEASQGIYITATEMADQFLRSLG
jgi:hypothetical protein